MLDGNGSYLALFRGRRVVGAVRVPARCASDLGVRLNELLAPVLAGGGEVALVRVSDHPPGTEQVVKGKRRRGPG